MLEFCVCFRSEGSEYWDSNDVSFELRLKNNWRFSQQTYFNANFHFHFKQGKNYRILKKRSTFASHSPGILMMDESQKFPVNLYGGAADQKNSTTTKSTNPIAIPNGKYNDLTQSKMTSYSEFASWNHLDNECPYWWIAADAPKCVERWENNSIFTSF